LEIGELDVRYGPFVQNKKKERVLQIGRGKGKKADERKKGAESLFWGKSQYVKERQKEGSSACKREGGSGGRKRYFFLNKKGGKELSLASFDPS